MNGKWLLLFLLSVSRTGGYAQSPPARRIATADSVTVAAGTRYKNPSFFKRLFLGSNYRTVWANAGYAARLQPAPIRFKDQGNGRRAANQIAPAAR
jgi:hypothetical protein